MKRNKKSLQLLISKNKGVIAVMVVAVIALCGGAVAAYFVLFGPQMIETGNARVTTDLVTIHSQIPGVLERFNLYEGRTVQEGEVLGWIEGGESFSSPIRGVVVHTSAKPNQRVMPQEPLATIADTANIHIQANIEETDIHDVRLGQPATVIIDALGNRRFTGYVRKISRINQHELAGMPFFLGTSGTFRRITNTIPVEIVIKDEVDLTHFLGANARVKLRVGEEINHTIANSGAQSRLRRVIIATGKVEPIHSRNIFAGYAAQSFRVERIHTKWGDRVEEGQVLATLDVTDIETQMAILRVNSELAAAKTQLESAKREYDDAQTDFTGRTSPQVVEAEGILRATEITLHSLKTDYAIALSLYTAGGLARRDLHNAKTASTLAENNYHEARIHHENALAFERRQLAQLRTALTATQVAYDNAQKYKEYALRQLEKLRAEGEIRATINGMVTDVRAKVGEFAVGPLFTVENVKDVRISATVREYDLRHIHIGMNVAVEAAATGQAQHLGTITRIASSPVSDVPVATYQIMVSVEPNTALRPGMSARIAIEKP